MVPFLGFLLFLVLLVLRILLAVLLLVVAVVLLILFVPFRYDFKGHRYEEDMAAVGQLGWLFGLVSAVGSYTRSEGFQMRLVLFSRWRFGALGNGRTADSDQALKKKAKQKEKDTAKKKSRAFRLTREKLGMLLSTLSRVLRRVMPRQVWMDARIGFSDPADTGTLCAVLAPLQVLFRTDPSRYHLLLEPVFEEEEASGQLELHGSLLIGFIVWEGLKLAISRPFRRDIFPFLYHNTQSTGMTKVKHTIVES
jgi:hypothetical protein